MPSKLLQKDWLRPGRQTRLVRIALLRFALVKLESLSTARSISTSERSAFCAQACLMRVQALHSHMQASGYSRSNCSRSRRMQMQAREPRVLHPTSKFARATTVFMKYVPCSFVFLKLQSRQSAAVKLDRLRSCGAHQAVSCHLKGPSEALLSPAACCEGVPGRESLCP